MHSMINGQLALWYRCQIRRWLYTWCLKWIKHVYVTPELCFCRCWLCLCIYILKATGKFGRILYKVLSSTNTARVHVGICCVRRGQRSPPQRGERYDRNFYVCVPRATIFSKSPINKTYLSIRMQDDSSDAKRCNEVLFKRDTDTKLAMIWMFK